MTSNYEQLQASGLPITWTAIRRGRMALLISVDQVQSYAGDQLGCGAAETAYLAFRLFDADPTNDWEIDSLLTQLPESEYPKGNDAARRNAEETAERTWNLLAVREFIHNTDASYVSAPTDDLDLEEGVFFFLELLANPEVRVAFPATFDFELPEDIAATKPTYAYKNSEWPLYGEAMTALRQWADSQEKLLQMEREENFLP